MKKIIIFLAVLLVGCSYSKETYLSEPKTILADPLTVQYKKDLADLESAYLQKRVSYVDYLQKKEQIEDNYTAQVEKREGRQDQPYKKYF